ncbi:MAG TPA: magnesium transporter [Actinomycetota bacterium]|nr:magnesium transporter [Actinomycetota bacterium]
MRFPRFSASGRRQLRRRFLELLTRQRTNMRQGMGALLVSSVGDLAAGLALGFMTGTLDRLPGLIVLVPAAIGMRGNIFGALGSRLGTAIHTGEFEGRVERRNLAGQNVMASAALTLYVSLALALLAKEVARLFGSETIPFTHYITVSVVGGLLSSVVILLITLGVAAMSVRRGWDMDNVAAPVVTAAGDLITLPALWLTTFLLPVGALPELVTLLTVLAIGYSTLYQLHHKELRIFRRVVRGSLAILIVAGLVDVIAGVTIEQRLEHFLTYPGLLVLIPPFLEDAGALGGILSARLSSKLHLGSIPPQAIPSGRSWEDILMTYILGVPVFFFVGLSGTVVSHAVGLETPGLGSMLALTLLAGAVATTGAIFVAYYTAMISFRFGLDPDNYGIPVVTSSMDLIGAVALILSMIWLGIA